MTPRLVKTRRAALAAVCLVVGALGYSAATALADGDPATQNITTGDLLLPYDGYLMLDSAGASGTVRLRFELFEAPAGGAAPEWSEEQDVMMHDGHFSAALGRVTQLNEAVLDAQKLWLAITVLEDDGQGGVREIGLSGRQLLEVTPFAAWSAHAADLKIAGALTVGADFRAGGDIQAAGDLRAAGTNMHLGTGDVAGFGDGGRALAQGPGDALLINPDGGFSNTRVGGASLKMNGALQNQGDATLGDGDDTITVRGGLEVQGETQAQSGLEMTSGQEITGATRVQGASGLALGATASAEGLSMDASGNITIQGDLIVNGRLPLSLTPDVSRNAPGSVSLGLSSDEGFCFLTRVHIDHGSSNSDMECRLGINVLNQWSLTNQGGTSGGSNGVQCRARCVRF